MKLYELLLEARERLDRSKYGAWLDSNTGEIHYVSEYGHVQYIVNNVRDKSIFGNDFKKADDYAVYTYAFKHGLVRLIFPNYGIIIAGTQTAIKRVIPIIMPTCNVVGEIVVELRKPDGERQGLGKTFLMPQNRRSLIATLNGEQEDQLPIGRPQSATTRYNPAAPF